MKIIAENKYARVEATIKVNSPNKRLVPNEIKAFQLSLADSFIEILGKVGRAPYTAFSVSNGEIKVTPIRKKER